MTKLTVLIALTLLLGSCARPAPPTPTPISLEPTPQRIAYYYFVAPADSPRPKGTVVIMPNTYFLAPTPTERTHGPDTAADLRVALEAALDDSRNGWSSSNLEIADVTVADSHADVAIEGEYFGVGDVTLIAAKMQILMTVFANASVQTASVTLNGDTIGNMGVSIGVNAKPVNYVFTRTDVEAFIRDNTEVLP